MQRSAPEVCSLPVGQAAGGPCPAAAIRPESARSHRRLRGGLVAAAGLGLLAVAFGLHPNASGTGTHQALGLPACSMLARTGWPCPTCGLTTSMSAMAHGQFALAARANPFGVLLFAAVCALAAAATAEGVTGRDVLGRVPWARLWFWLTVLAALLAGWGAKIAIGLANGSLPVR